MSQIGQMVCQIASDGLQCFLQTSESYSRIQSSRHDIHVNVVTQSSPTVSLFKLLQLASTQLNARLPVLAEIAPPALRREAATPVLGHPRANTIIYYTTPWKIPPTERDLRCPLTHHAHQLVSSVPPQETVKHWTQTRWAESWASTTTRLHRYMPTPSNSGQDVGLSRRAWTRLIVVSVIEASNSNPS